MLPHALYFRGIEIAQFDRELSPARYDVDGSRFRLHIADRADLMAVFRTHCLTHGADFLCCGRQAALPVIPPRRPLVIRDRRAAPTRSLEANNSLYGAD